MLSDHPSSNILLVLALRPIRYIDVQVANPETKEVKIAKAVLIPPVPIIQSEYFGLQIGDPLVLLLKSCIVIV